MVDLRLSPAAKADLVEIRKYSNELFGADVADTYFLGFDELFQLLRRHPRAGSEKREFGKGIRSITHRKHRVFYHLKGDYVLIVRIIHHAQDARRALNS